MNRNMTSSAQWSCLHSMNIIPTFLTWNSQCLSCRLGGFVILLISIICFVLNLHYVIWYRQRRHRNTLVLSLFLASLLVLTVSVPSVLLQLFTCHRHCNEIYCRIEGFTSYLCGCLCMVIYMFLSINRYLLLRRYDQQLFYRYATIICWILSIGWTFPPMFNYGTSYVPEGLGFHCSIDWNNHSKTNRFYILFSFIGIYFIPLIILFIVNIHVHKIIQNTYFHQSSYTLPQQINSSLLNRRRHRFQQEFDHHLNTTICCIHKAADRKRLRADYRFVRAIIYLVSAYLFAWTPYAFVAVLQLFHVQFVLHHGIFVTLTAIIAKLSVVLSPLVYLSIMHFRLFKKLLFQ